MVESNEATALTRRYLNHTPTDRMQCVQCISSLAFEHFLHRSTAVNKLRLNWIYYIQIWKLPFSIWSRRLRGVDFTSEWNWINTWLFKFKKRREKEKNQRNFFRYCKENERERDKIWYRAFAKFFENQINSNENVKWMAIFRMQTLIRRWIIYIPKTDLFLSRCFLFLLIYVISNFHFLFTFYDLYFLAIYGNFTLDYRIRCYFFLFLDCLKGCMNEWLSTILSFIDPYNVFNFSLFLFNFSKHK